MDKGRAPSYIGTEVIRPPRMTAEADHDLAQARCPRKLPVQQCHELALRPQPANPAIRTVRLDKPVERTPGNMLQNRVKNAILVPHGVVPCSCPGSFGDVQDRVESAPCTSSTKTQPDSRGPSPAMTGGCLHPLSASSLIGRRVIPARLRALRRYRWD